MTRQEDSSRYEDILELLATHGLEGLARAMEILLNEAMRLERADFLRATPHERTPDRRGYANGFKPKIVKGRVGELRLEVPQVRAVEEGDRFRFVPPRGESICLKQMIEVNTVGKADGELAAWINGQLYLHYRGFRWRKTERLKIKRFTFGIYIHQARRKNVVWYDDVAVSTGYLGPLKRTRRG